MTLTVRHGKIPTMFKFGKPSINGYKWAIFHGYVKLPEGIYIYTYINTKDTEYGDVSARFWILIGKDHLLLELQSL